MPPRLLSAQKLNAQNMPKNCFDTTIQAKVFPLTPTNRGPNAPGTRRNTGTTRKK